MPTVTKIPAGTSGNEDPEKVKAAHKASKDALERRRVSQKRYNKHRKAPATRQETP